MKILYKYQNPPETVQHLALLFYPIVFPCSSLGICNAGRMITFPGHPFGSPDEKWESGCEQSRKGELVFFIVFNKI